LWPGFKGGTTEGTLGRVSSTVANRARCSDGGGVLINFIKLAAVFYSTYRAKKTGDCNLAHCAISWENTKARIYGLFAGTGLLENAGLYN
jgi:hypothetical protein